MVAPGAIAGQQHHGRAQSAHQADCLDCVELQVAAGAERARRFIGERDVQPDEKNNIRGAHGPHPWTQTHVSRVQLQPQVVVIADDGRQWPADEREPQDAKDGDHEQLIEVTGGGQAHPLQNNGREVGYQLHLAALIAAEGDQVLAVHGAVNQRRNLLPFFYLSVEVLERLNLDGSVLIRRDLNILIYGGNLEEVAFRAAAAQVMSGHGVRIGLGGGKLLNFWRRIRKVAVKKVFPQRGARADLAFAAAVVRDKESHAVFQHEMHVTVEIDGVSAVPDDAMAVARLFIEAQAHAVQSGAEPKLPRMHLLCGLLPEDLRVLEFPGLQVGDHEAREIGGGGRQRSGRRFFNDFEWRGFAG